MYLQDRHKWDDTTWNSINWKGLKSGYLSLGPLKWIKTSKSMHGWLNTGWQKLKMSLDAPESHKCPRCQEMNETQEHILKCQSVGAHKKWYDLVHPMMKKIRMDNLCQVQEVFTKCIRPWLESPQTVFLYQMWAVYMNHKVNYFDRKLLTMNALVGIWQWEGTSASIGDWQYLQINILRRTTTKVKYG